MSQEEKPTQDWENNLALNWEKITTNENSLVSFIESVLSKFHKRWSDKLKKIIEEMKITDGFCGENRNPKFVRDDFVLNNHLAQGYNVALEDFLSTLNKLER